MKPAGAGPCGCRRGFPVGAGLKRQSGFLLSFHSSIRVSQSLAPVCPSGFPVRAGRLGSDAAVGRAGGAACGTMAGRPVMQLRCLPADFDWGRLRTASARSRDAGCFETRDICVRYPCRYLCRGPMSPKAAESCLAQAAEVGVCPESFETQDALRRRML